MALRKDRTLSELSDFARLVVRAGYLNQARTLAEVGNFVRAELGDEAEADALTVRLVDEAERELAAEQATWPERTDNDALSEVFTDLAERRFLVLEYCQDHFDASAELRARPDAVLMARGRPAQPQHRTVRQRRVGERPVTGQARRPRPELGRRQFQGGCQRGQDRVERGRAGCGDLHVEGAAGGDEGPAAGGRGRETGRCSHRSTVRARGGLEAAGSACVDGDPSVDGWHRPSGRPP